MKRQSLTGVLQDVRDPAGVLRRGAERDAEDLHTSRGPGSVRCYCIRTLALRPKTFEGALELKLAGPDTRDLRQVLGGGAEAAARVEPVTQGTQDEGQKRVLDPGGGECFQRAREQMAGQR